MSTDKGRSNAISTSESVFERKERRECLYCERKRLALATQAELEHCWNLADLSFRFGRNQARSLDMT
jgi:hypothetical protein